MDFEATQDAAFNAQSSAQEAQNNAQAAAHASLTNLNDISSSAGAHSHQSQTLTVSETSNHAFTSSVPAPSQPSSPSSQKSQSSSENKDSDIAANHNYGSEFKPSNPYNYAGY